MASASIISEEIFFKYPDIGCLATIAEPATLFEEEDKI